MQWLAWLLLLGAAVAAVGGTMVLKDRIRIVVQEDGAGEGPDPVALLRDEVRAVGRDLEALTAALGGNLERLVTTLDAAAAARHEDVRGARAELAAMRNESAAARAGLAQELARLGQAVAALQAGAEPHPRPEIPVRGPDPTVASAPAMPTTSAPPAAAAEPEIAAAAAPTPRRAGFLSFQLPSRSFRFDQEQDFVVIPELSRVGFDARSTLHDFSGVTSTVTGAFHADLHDPAGGWRGAVTCRAETLLTGVDGRDAGLREHLATEQFPEIRFELTGFRPDPDGIDASAQTVRGIAHGRMTIRGRTRDLVMPLQVGVDPSWRVVVEGQVPLKLSDYEVPVPSKLGLISMQDEVKVWIALRARPQGGGTHGP